MNNLKLMFNLLYRLIATLFMDWSLLKFSRPEGTGGSIKNVFLSFLEGHASVHSPLSLPLRCVNNSWQLADSPLARPRGKPRGLGREGRNSSKQGGQQCLVRFQALKRDEAVCARKRNRLVGAGSQMSDVGGAETTADGPASSPAPRGLSEDTSWTHECVETSA